MNRWGNENLHFYTSYKLHYLCSVELGYIYMQKKSHGGRRRFQHNRNHRNRNHNHNHNNNNNTNQNRNNNIANRVWDSNGPGGRIRGTAQQLVDKYISLAEEQTGPNADGVLRETLLQFAEHYQRILVEAGLSREQRAAEEERKRQAREAELEALGEMTLDGDDDTPPSEVSTDNDADTGSDTDSEQSSDDTASDTGILDLSQASQPVLDLSDDPAVRSNMEETSKLAANKNAKRQIEEEKPAKKARAKKARAKKTTAKKSRAKKSDD